MTLVRRKPTIPCPCQQMRKPLDFDFGYSSLAENSIGCDWLGLFELVPLNSPQSALVKCEYAILYPSEKKQFGD